MEHGVFQNFDRFRKKVLIFSKDFTMKLILNQPEN